MIRPPKSLTNLPTTGSRQPSGAEVLEAEMRGEQAYALGLAAERMERTLTELSQSNGDPRHVQLAADAVQSFFIQREMIGFANHDYVVEFYKIPSFVMARVGAKDPDA